MMHLHDEPVYDFGWEAEELARDATHRYLLLEYGYNLRLIAVPLGKDSWGYDYGWCYSRLGGKKAVRQALEAFDPATQDEPMGWHKRPTEARRAPHREKDPHYNRPRCVHGSYLEDGKCAVDQWCREMRAMARRGA